MLLPKAPTNLSRAEALFDLSYPSFPSMVNPSEAGKQEAKQPPRHTALMLLKWPSQRRGSMHGAPSAA